MSDTYDDIQDWVPEDELDAGMTSVDDIEEIKCQICQSIIYEDGTAEDCQGECDLSVADRLVPDQELDFN